MTIRVCFEKKHPLFSSLKEFTYENMDVCLDAGVIDRSFGSEPDYQRTVFCWSYGSRIQIDRYSALQGKGIGIEYLDKNNCFAGWKTLFSKSNTALIYNKVDFGNEKVEEITIRAKSAKGGVLVVRADGKKGNIIAKVKIPESADWLGFIRLSNLNNNE